MNHIPTGKPITLFDGTRGARIASRYDIKKGSEFNMRVEDVGLRTFKITEVLNRGPASEGPDFNHYIVRTDMMNYLKECVEDVSKSGECANPASPPDMHSCNEAPEPFEDLGGRLKLDWFKNTQDNRKTHNITYEGATIGRINKRDHIHEVLESCEPGQMFQVHPQGHVIWMKLILLPVPTGDDGTEAWFVEAITDGARYRIPKQRREGAHWLVGCSVFTSQFPMKFEAIELL